MSLTTRQDAILKTLRTKGSIDVDALAVDWNITTQTVRRDLTVLCDAGLAVRTHGGAKQAPLSTAIAYESRRLRNTKAKQTIAKTAASLIPDGASLALNIGTTTELVAEHLRLHRALTVVTNNTNIVPILRTSPIKSLILIGGEIRLSDGAVVGGDALDTIEKYRVDFAVIGASCIDPNGAILDFDQREVMVARALLNAARTKILVADSSKFEATAPHKICDVGDLDTVILDAPPPDTFAKALSKANTNLLIANEPYND
jgi:DeoR family glycerol-3-phosphate regulon repressor